MTPTNEENECQRLTTSQRSRGSPGKWDHWAAPAKAHRRARPAPPSFSPSRAACRRPIALPAPPAARCAGVLHPYRERGEQQCTCTVAILRQRSSAYSSRVSSEREKKRAIEACLDCKFLQFRHCSTFRLYLTNFIRLLIN